jgi:serine/threonine protein kinase
VDFQGQVLLDRYEIGPELGAGGAATVYRADDLRLGRVVAIKLLRPELRGDPTFVARFEREARSIARLEHPHIVPIYDYGEGLGTYFLAMQYVPGGNLRARVRRDGSLSIAAAVRIGAEVAEALGAAHAHGIVHRDVKSANILLMEDDGAKVTDFGIAKMLDVPALTASAALLGTPHYLAPEQASGGAITPATDVYALGIVLYEMLAGRRPYEGDSFVWIAMQHMCAIPQPLAELNSAVPADLAALVERVLAKEPEQRFPDGTAFAAALRSLERALGVPHDVSTSDLADEPGAPTTEALAGAVHGVSPDLDSGPRRLPSQAALASVASPGWRLPSPTPPAAAPAPATVETAAARAGEPLRASASPLPAPPPPTPARDRVAVAAASSEAPAAVDSALPDTAPAASSASAPPAEAATEDLATEAPMSNGRPAAQTTMAPLSDTEDAVAAPSTASAEPLPGTGDSAQPYFPRRRTSFVPIVLVLGLGLVAAILVALAMGEGGAARVAQVAGRTVEATAVPATGETVAEPAAMAAPAAVETPAPPATPTALATAAPTTAPTAVPTTAPAAAPTEVAAAALPAPTEVTAAAPAPAPPEAEAPPAAPAIAGGRAVLDDDAFTGGYSAPRNYRGRTARWVYGALSQYGQMTTSFTIPGTPGAGTLLLRGLDSENGPKTPIQVLVNDSVVYQGGNPLPKDDWRGPTATYGEATIEIPRGVLHAGRNTLTLKNQAPVANFNVPPYVVLDEAIVTY